MLKGKLDSGFKFEIEEYKLDDIELLELMSKADENPLLFPQVIDKLLGEEQKKKLYDSLRTKQGNVPIQSVGDAVAEMFEKVGELKNS